MVARAPVADGSLTVDSTWDYDAFLSGYRNNAEVEASEVACADLPRDLVGTYYRNGHARFVGRDGRKVRHPFDADGMVCAVTLDGHAGTAVVRQRYVATDGAVKERAAGKSIYPGQFGNPLPFWKGGAQFKNLANTGVMWHAGKLLALWEGSRPHVLDPLSLATVAEWDVDGLVGRGSTDSFSAHPRDTPEGGKANFAYFGNPATGRTTVRFWDFSPGSFQLRSPAQTHQVPGFGLYHDFMVTDNWFIVTAAPSTWGKGGWDSLRGTMEWVAGKRTVVSMIAFDETQPTVAHFFPREQSRGAQPVAVPLDTFFAFHHANAYEDPDTGAVVFDTVRSALYVSIPPQ
jgi:all-trans-8'-apo-beta-carotenal 15,15'-oxygenase